MTIATHTVEFASRVETQQNYANPEQHSFKEGAAKYTFRKMLTEKTHAVNIW